MSPGRGRLHYRAKASYVCRKMTFTTTSLLLPPALPPLPVDLPIRVDERSMRGRGEKGRETERDRERGGQIMIDKERGMYERERYQKKREG